MTNRLSSVVARVNHYGDTQILIADPAVGAHEDQRRIQCRRHAGFVEIVTHYLPVKAVTEGQHAIALESATKKNGTL